MTAPVDRIKLTQQSNENREGVFSIGKRIYIKRGIKGFWDGNMTGIIKVLSEFFIKYHLYIYYYNEIIKKPNAKINLVQRL